MEIKTSKITSSSWINFNPFALVSELRITRHVYESYKSLFYSDWSKTSLNVPKGVEALKKYTHKFTNILNNMKDYIDLLELEVGNAFIKNSTAGYFQKMLNEWNAACPNFEFVDNEDDFRKYLTEIITTKFDIDWEGVLKNVNENMQLKPKK